jgi:hypothetical protein
MMEPRCAGVSVCHIVISEEGALSELQFDGELRGARTTHGVLWALSANGSAAAQGEVCCGARIYLAKIRVPEVGFGFVESRGSKHGVVEYIEVLCAHIEVDAFRQVEAPTERKIGLVYGVGAAQSVAGEISRLIYGWSRKSSRIETPAGRLGGIGDPEGLTGHDVNLRRVIAHRRQERRPSGYIDRWGRTYAHQSKFAPTTSQRIDVFLFALDRNVRVLNSGNGPAPGHSSPAAATLVLLAQRLSIRLPIGVKVLFAAFLPRGPHFRRRDVPVGPAPFRDRTQGSGHCRIHGPGQQSDDSPCHRPGAWPDHPQDIQRLLVLRPADDGRSPSGPVCTTRPASERNGQ